MILDYPDSYTKVKKNERYRYPYRCPRASSGIRRLCLVHRPKVRCISPYAGGTRPRRNHHHALMVPSGKATPPRPSTGMDVDRINCLGWRGLRRQDKMIKTALEASGFLEVADCVSGKAGTCSRQSWYLFQAKLVLVPVYGNILPLPVLSVEKRILKGAAMAVVTVMPSDIPPVKFTRRI
jgi:hypothetical protein